MAASQGFNSRTHLRVVGGDSPHTPLPRDTCFQDEKQAERRCQALLVMELYLDKLLKGCTESD